MNNGPKVIARPLGHGRDRRPSAVVADRGLEIELFFAEGDKLGEGAVQEVRARAASEPLEPRALTLREVFPRTDLYLAYAREAFAVGFGAAGSVEQLHKKAEALRAVGAPRRGHDDRFYRNIGTEYRALVAAGEQHPIKTLGETHHVTISAASRWVTEARRRGHLKEEKP
jgi:hypothetical protein